MNSNSDLYNILGLEKSCSISDINNAYKKLAIKWHPDKNQNNKEESEIKFKEISKAYQILSDEDKKKKYDNNVLIDGDIKNDANEIFNEMFKSEKVPDIIINIEAEINKLYNGFSTDINFTRYSNCYTCDGFGTKDKINSNCNKCNGRGVILESINGNLEEYTINEEKCHICNGNGINPDIELCNICNGDKYIKEDVECEIEIPAGAYSNYFIKLEIKIKKT
jgi:DnaJ-class molecular chaperone